ncbi:hypothetical protein E4U14_007525, partial [Claviceps sp. LM454 group G7]
MASAWKLGQTQRRGGLVYVGDTRATRSKSAMVTFSPQGQEKRHVSVEATILCKVFIEGAV